MTFDVNKTIKYWSDGASYDLETGRSLLESKKFCLQAKLILKFRTPLLINLLSIQSFILKQGIRMKREISTRNVQRNSPGKTFAG